MGASYTAVEGIAEKLSAPPLVRAAIYCRRSRRGGRSVERQEEDGRRIAADKGWEVVAVYREWASASPYAKKTRKEWDALLAAVEAGQLDAVIVWMEDRTTRDVVQAGAFVQACRKAGLKQLVLPSFDYDLTDQQAVTRFYGEVLGGQREAALISKRSKRAHLEEAQNGRRHSGGKRAFGERGRKRVEGPDGTWRTVPAVSEAQAEAERALIAEAARRILAGDSLRGICLDWNEAGHQAPRGGRWTTQTLRRMLLSPRLAGLREHRGQLFEGSFLAILERETWQVVRAILTDPARMTTAVGGAARHLLTGRIFCGACKAKLRTTRYGPHRVLYYRCPSRSDGGRNCVARKVEDVDRLILRAIFRAVENGDASNPAAAARPAEDPSRPQYEVLARLTAELDALDAMVAEAELAERLGGKPSPSSATLRHKVTEREAERERHQVAVNRLTAGRVAASIPRNLRSIWKDLSLDRQRAIVAALIDRIEVHPQGQGPFDPDTIKVKRRG
ncbi:MAG TPA: recombinase family protein [Actinomycetota bacterium]|jgi:DNA invertase Pin-like site-specific DNA recombinase|nr:recombinase family protein [Actinomycetota bacterium]